MPFAQHYFDSSAVDTDREIGSGAFGQQSLKVDVPSTAYVATIREIPVYTQLCRLGEAVNPGPCIDSDASLLTVGVGNPGGLRSKEDLLLDLGAGIWTMTETQLSDTTMTTTAAILRSSGRQRNRNVRSVYSAPAALRPGSDWAGRWSGVMVCADFPSTILPLQWPDEHWDSARVLVTRHWVGPCPIVVGSFYGYSQGPTWPRSKQMSDALLQTYTNEIVLGMQGVRLIQGDFNYEPSQLQQQQLWLWHGWRNAQDLGQELFGWSPTPTCKHSTQRDQIWLSPEAIQLLRKVEVFDYFADHSIVKVELHVPDQLHPIQTWPRPSRLPWTLIHTEDWSPENAVDFEAPQDSTKFFSDISNAYESACEANHMAHGHGKLHPNMKGRGQRLRPMVVPPHTPCARSSREGEVQLAHAVTGSATRLWFKQLRRLQSLKHAVLANNHSHSAVAYRAELWSAIVRGAGFSPSFETWWSLRTPIVDGSPAELPQGPPVVGSLAVLLYEEFHAHFRKFERWHAAQRAACLKSRYEGSLQAIFRDLKPTPKGSINHLWYEQCYTVLAVDDETGRAQLDKTIPVEHDFVWYYDAKHVIVTDIEGDMCTIPRRHDVFVGDELIQKIFVTDTGAILDLFRKYWQPRWNLFQQVSTSDWERILAFAQVYMPKHQFTVAPLTSSTWRRSVSRFKPNSARGPDGFDKDDMRHIPDSFLNPILKMLTSIETTDQPWPQQLLLGLVIGQAKHDQAHQEAHFRPITLFSMWYRNWAKLRTREAIQQIAAVMPPEALGFLPGREPAEVWFVLQSHIEVMLQLNVEYCGLSTDLQKAFNHIGRAQTFLVAEHIGLDSQLLRPWKKFLDTFCRRFEIQTAVSDAVGSSSGYPEGCPLSIVAMLCVNWAFHQYMLIFAPKIRAYSFVDNLTMSSLHPEHLARAFFTLKTLFELFGLSTDDSKTFVWGTSSRARQLLKQLGFPCLQDTNELGGAMTYGSSIRNRTLKARGASLQLRWDKLKRSFAPLLQKYSVLPLSFWPKALHGSTNCLISDAYALELRRQAVKSLKVNGAGSNPLLRLTLSGKMINDPGFYQLRLCLSTMQRLLRKVPDLEVLWRIRMEGYDGRLLPGPFSRFLQCISVVGWHPGTPPYVTDHESRTWNLLTIDGKTLGIILEDAWLQHVSTTVRHRTMTQLAGMDGFLTCLHLGQLSPHHRSLLSALHSGAFITAFEKSRFDPAQLPMCAQCGCEDDRAHWLVCPRFASVRSAIPGWTDDLVQLPDSFVNHLLVPKLAAAVAWRNALWHIEDRTMGFSLNIPPAGLNHVFVDGSCTNPEFPVMKLAAWAVVGASCGDVLAMGQLQGLVQTIDRAELTAMLVALRWVAWHQVEACIWADSLSTVGQTIQIQQTDYVPDDIANYDLWLQVRDELRQCGSLRLWLRWVPSHVPSGASEDAMEDWLIYWNGKADACANMVNAQRSSEFLQLRRSYEDQLRLWTTRIHAMRTFYFKVAELGTSATDQDSMQPIAAEDPALVDNHPDDEYETLEDQLPVNWKVQCSQLHGAFPIESLFRFVDWWCDLEQHGSQTHFLNEVELVFALILTDFGFPVKSPSTGLWTFVSPALMFQKPTLAALLRHAQFCLRGLMTTFPHLTFSSHATADRNIGIHKPFKRYRLRLTPDFYQQIRQRVGSFFTTRPLRRANDLARPVA
eukprot:Skav206886  [mRNA]  locus=scaffold3287:72863:77896:+ [translate_table: standard]